MKKLFALLMASLLVFAVGCSQSSDSGSTDEGTTVETTEETTDETTEETTDEGASEEDSNAEAASALMQFELDLTTKLHEAAAPFTSIAALTEVAKEDYDASQLKTLVEEANTSATDFAAWVEGLEAPAELSEDLKTKLDAAMKELAANFEKRAEEIQAVAGAKNPEELATKWEAFSKAVTPGFESFNTKMTEINEALGLGAASFTEEIH